MLNTAKAPIAVATTVDDVCDAPHLDPRGTEARRGALMSAGAVRAVADTFRILGDPTRIRILDALSGGELCVCDIASLAAISESAVSHQLRLLRSMRLVKSRRAGRLVFYALDDQHIIELLRQTHTHVEERA
jgi:ArsR family transcriptional regulator, lead/cadmium/zinc/bismuth-responsive transcriptional repressor